MSHLSVDLQILEALRNALGEGDFSLHEPRFTGNELAYLESCLRSTYVSSVGEYVNRFEMGLAEYTGAKYVVAVVNGTAALDIALKIAGVVANDEVIVPTMSFVATANAVIYQGATPHFVDVNPSTLGMDALALRDWLSFIGERTAFGLVNRKTSKRIRAIVPMHAFGHPCDLDDLMSIANDFKVHLVEDAAESLGSFYDGRHTGTFGLLGALSFNGNKIITTGGGGAILTDNEELARSARHLTTTAKIPHAWEYKHDRVGYNYRMPNLNAALGCAQLERLTEFLRSKRALTKRYMDAFKSTNVGRLIVEPPKSQSNYWLQTFLLRRDLADYRDQVITATNDQGISTRPVWSLLHTQLPFRGCPRAPTPIAESLESRLINLPSSAGLE